MGIQFEQWFGESRYQDRLVGLTKRLVAMGVAVESEGALIIPVAKDESDSIPPLILQNSEEGFGYGATDIATLDERINDFTRPPHVCMLSMPGKVCISNKSIGLPGNPSRRANRFSLSIWHLEPSMVPMGSRSRRERAA